MKTLRIIKFIRMVKPYGTTLKTFRRAVKASPDGNYGKYAPARKLKKLWVNS